MIWGKEQKKAISFLSNFDFFAMQSQRRFCILVRKSSLTKVKTIEVPEIRSCAFSSERERERESVRERERGRERERERDTILGTIIETAKSITIIAV